MSALGEFRLQRLGSLPIHHVAVEMSEDDALFFELMQDTEEVRALELRKHKTRAKPNWE